MDNICGVCGNEQPENSLTCRFCGAKQELTVGGGKNPQIHRVVNIEIGKPTIEQALARLAQEMERARIDGVAVLTVIHGYGASGRGGAIRRECRKILEFYKEKHIIRSYIHGESFSKKTGPTRSLLRRIPLLAKNANLNKRNKGITVVEL